MKFKKSQALVEKIYNSAFQGFRKNPSWLIPFLIFAAIELTSLFMLVLIPRMPFKVLFGPIIRTFWGEVFLHYPDSFLLLPRLASLARIVLAVLAGSLLTGTVVGMVSDFCVNKRVNFRNSFRLALKNYISLAMIIFILMATFYALQKIFAVVLIKYFTSGHTRFLFLKANIWLGPIFALFNFFMAIFIQALFTYAVPFLIIGQEKVLAAIGKSVVLFKRLFLPTVMLVGLPMLLYIPITVLGYNNAILIKKFFPEITIWVLVLTTLVTSLCIDSMITVSTTFLYLDKEKID